MSEEMVVDGCHSCACWKAYSRNPELGECRRHPPRIIDCRITEVEDGYLASIDQIQDATYFPVTNVDAWCGEFRELQHPRPVDSSLPKCTETP